MPDTLYATIASEHLARGLIRHLAGFEIGRLGVARFADGEISVALRDLPKGRAVLVSATGPHESRLTQTLLTLDALKSARAQRPVLVIPYAGFARQDEVAAGTGTPARLVPRLLRLSGAHRMVVLDPHSAVTTRSAAHVLAAAAAPVLAQALKKYASGAVVVAPDRGARTRAMQLAALLGGLPTAYVEKVRPAPDVAVAKRLSGSSVKGKTVILVDDIIDTAGTMVASARLVKSRGAALVVAAATHGVFSGTAARDLAASCADVVVTNSLLQTESKKVHVVDCAPVLASAVRKYAGA